MRIVSPRFCAEVAATDGAAIGGIAAMRFVPAGTIAIVLMSATLPARSIKAKLLNTFACLLTR